MENKPLPQLDDIEEISEFKSEVDQLEESASVVTNMLEDLCDSLDELEKSLEILSETKHSSRCKMKRVASKLQ